MIFFNFIPSNVNYLECVSIKNQDCKTRTKIADVNSNEPVFYPFSIKANKCGESCNGISDPYAKLCVPDIIKKISFQVPVIKISHFKHITNQPIRDFS